MWFCLNNGFISVVQNKNNANSLVVRSRKKKHLYKNFKNKKIIHTKNSDYPYRIYMGREEFAKHIFNSVMNINYTNFKESVKDKELYNFYLNTWVAAIIDLQKEDYYFSTGVADQI